MSFPCLNPFISINAGSVLVICERGREEGKKATAGLSSITSSLGLASEPGTPRPPREVIQNNRVTIGERGITDTENCFGSTERRQRTLVLSLEAFIFSSDGLLETRRPPPPRGKDRKLCILHHIYHSGLTYKVIITRLLAQVTLHVGGLSLFFSCDQAAL